jgi:hypothetical protein
MRKDDYDRGPVAFLLCCCFFFYKRASHSVSFRLQAGALEVCIGGWKCSDVCLIHVLITGASQSRDMFSITVRVWLSEH